MYPNLETNRLLLRPMIKNDFESMSSLYSNPGVTATMEGGLQNPGIFKKGFDASLRDNNVLVACLKQTNEFIGFIGIHQFINKKKAVIKHSHTWMAFLPEYWGQGYCTEALQKVLHFAFLGIKTPKVNAHQFQDNPAYGRALIKCGFKYHATNQKENRSYDHYQYLREDYIKDNSINAETEGAVYDYTVPIRKSPYSYENPIRIIDDITYIKEPTGYLCGQSVIAMLAGVSIDEVVEIMENDKGTSASELDYTMHYYGIKHTQKRTRINGEYTLPDICILSLKLPGYGHWSLYYKGTYYDPEFGVSNELPPNAKLNHYWEVFS